MENILAVYEDENDSPGIDTIGVPEAFQIAKDGGNSDNIKAAYDAKVADQIENPKPANEASPPKKMAKKAPAEKKAKTL